ncbi:MAG: uridine kinase family protein [Actinomycetales bacterium]
MGGWPFVDLHCRVVLLTGPSGSGKTRLVRRLGLPTIALDDFYRDGDEPGLPETLGIVDWDDPRTWDAQRALAALVEVARTGRVEVPVYDIPTSRTVGAACLDARRSPLVIAEGIFAAELVGPARDAGILADALILTHSPWVTFARRLTRDLAERRKPPLTLLRRGWALRRAEPAIVRRQVALGGRPVSVAEAEHRIRLLSHGAGDGAHGAARDSAHGPRGAAPDDAASPTR